MARYLSFIAYACATTFLPGPNNILMMTQASRYGVKKLWPLLFGIWSGLLAVMLLAGAFCAGLSSCLGSCLSIGRSPSELEALHLVPGTAGEVGEGYAGAVVVH